MNTYAAYHVMYGGMDPWGMESLPLTVVNEMDFNGHSTQDLERSATHLKIEARRMIKGGDWDSASHRLAIRKEILDEVYRREKERKEQEAEQRERDKKARAAQELREALNCEGHGNDYLRDQQRRDIARESAGNTFSYLVESGEIIATTVGTEALVGTVMLPVGGPLANLARRGGQLVKVGGTWVIKHGEDLIPFSQLDDAAREAAEAIAKNLDCPDGEIVRKINQFRNKSLRDQRNVYNKLKNTYDEHLKKYGQTPGETLGETYRMERELQHMQQILGERGQTFNASGVLQ